MESNRSKTAFEGVLTFQIEEIDSDSPEVTASGTQGHRVVISQAGSSFLSHSRQASEREPESQVSEGTAAKKRKVAEVKEEETAVREEDAKIRMKLPCALKTEHDVLTWLSDIQLTQLIQPLYTDAQGFMDRCMQVFDKDAEVKDELAKAIKNYQELKEQGKVRKKLSAVDLLKSLLLRYSTDQRKRLQILACFELFKNGLEDIPVFSLVAGKIRRMPGQPEVYASKESKESKASKAPTIPELFFDPDDPAVYLSTGGPRFFVDADLLRQVQEKIPKSEDNKKGRELFVAFLISKFRSGVAANSISSNTKKIFGKCVTEDVINIFFKKIEFAMADSGSLIVKPGSASESLQTETPLKPETPPPRAEAPLKLETTSVATQTKAPLKPETATVSTQTKAPLKTETATVSTQTKAPLKPETVSVSIQTDPLPE